MTMVSALDTKAVVKGSAANLSLEEKLKLVPLDGAQFERKSPSIPGAPKTVALADNDNPGRKKLALSAAAAVLGSCAVLAWSFQDHSAAQELGTVVQHASASPTTMRPAPVEGVLTASGYVVARRQATIAAQFTGQVASILVTEGMRVEAGQLIARMDSSALASSLASAGARKSGTYAQVAAVDAELGNARTTLARYEELAARGFATRKDLDASRAQVAMLEARGRQVRADVSAAAADLAGVQNTLSQYAIRAPFGGTVIAINAQEGEIVSPISSGGGFTRTGICTIVDMESLELEVDVAEAHIARVGEGDPVEITLSAYPDVRYEGRVITVVPIADRSKASFKVRIEVLNRDERMLPEMVANVRFLGKP
ncbi:efflux RND transporter periplasmic adaptor subunit [Qipengyuania sp. 483]